MRFASVAKHRGIWPASWICVTLGVARDGFHAWLVRTPSIRSRSDAELAAKVRASFISSYRAYSARRVWHDLLAEGLSCGLHRVERLMRRHGLKARRRRRGLLTDEGRDDRPACHQCADDGDVASGQARRLAASLGQGS